MKANKLTSLPQYCGTGTRCAACKNPIPRRMQNGAEQCGTPFGHAKSTATLCYSFITTMSSDDSPPNNDPMLPTLQQAYHHDSDVMILDRLTPEGEEPGGHDYEFAAAFSDVQEPAEFDYGEDVK